ncbi:MAG TPA: Tim44-like domain-containing protein [Gallionellaceae bacterium]
MKRFILLVAVFLTCLSFISAPAEAKRFGGGSSTGKQRSISPQQTQQAAPAKPGAPAQPAAPAGNRWLGPLAGLAAGLGLAALFSSLGLGEGMGMLLMLVAGAMLLMFLVSMFRRKEQAATQYAGAGAPYHEPQPVQQPLSGSQGAAPNSNIPADFPVDAFLRSAKTSFIRLQAANDRKDLDDIREYTTPEMFAEISMQIRERDNTPQRTDVLSLDTALLEVSNEGDYAIASVRMTGQLRENNGAPENFDEVWHVQKNLRDDKAVWLLAGIQQLS